MKTKLRHIVLLMFVIILGACKEDKQTNTPTELKIDYSTFIIDSDGNTMVNSTVELYNSTNSEIIESDTTNENGIANISTITEQSENLEVSVIHPLSKPYSVNLNNIVDLNNHVITLEDKDDCCGSVEILIKDDEGNPIDGVEIKVRQDMKVLKKGKSDKEGKVLFSGLCLEEYEFRLAKEGYKVIEKLVTIENCDNSIELDLEMEAIGKEECCDGVIKLIVKDEDSNLLENKTVRLWKGTKKIKEFRTNIDGYVEFTDLCEGDDYSISIISEDFETYEFDFDLNCNKEIIFEKTLKQKTDCCDAVLKFIVKDKNSKEIIQNAKITLLLGSKTIFENKSTNADGEVSEGGLCKGKYTILIKREGYKTIETYWNVEKCDDLLEHFWMENENDDCCEGVLIFKPKGENGEVLNGTKVYIYKDDKIIQDPVVKEGKVIEDNLCEGKYTIIYKREGYKDKEVQVELGCNEEKTLEHTLEKNNDDCCEGVVRLKVTDDSGNYLKNRTVRLWKGSKKLKDVKTDDNGVVEFENLCEGNDYSISIISEDHENLEFEFDLDCNKEVTFEKSLKTIEDCCEAILKFIVKDNNNKEVIKDAKVTLKLNGKAIFEKRETNDDGYVIEDGLCKGKYTVIIEKEGYNTIETIWNVEKCDDFQEHFWLKSENEDCCEGALILKPKGENGDILNGTKIYIYKDGKLIQDPVVKDGKAIEDDLCKGKYTIVYKKEGYLEKEIHVELGCSEEKTLEHTLEKSNDDCCEAILKFIVKDNNNKEVIIGAKVTLKLNGKVIFEKRETNSDGFVIEDGLCKGKYTVIIEKDGYNTIETTWNVEKCDDFQEHFWLKK